MARLKALHTFSAIYCARMLIAALEAGHSWCLGPGLHRAEACVAVVDADAATPEAVTGGWVVFIDGGWCRAPEVSSEYWRSGLWNNKVHSVDHQVSVIVMSPP